MSSLSVLVFKNGKAQPNATVQLDGPSGRKAQNTNGAGAVTFADLMPGQYSVNASLLSEFLGNGFMNLKAGDGGVVYIKHPQTPVTPKTNATKGSLSVTVVLEEMDPPIARAIDGAEVKIAGPTFQSGRTKGGVATFFDLEPGDYSICASAVTPNGLATGESSKRVHAGKADAAWVYVDFRNPKGNESCTTGYKSREKLEAAIRESEVKCFVLRARIHGEEVALDNVRDSCNQENKPFSENVAEECYVRKGAFVPGMEKNISKMREELHSEQARLRSLKHQLSCAR